MNFAVLYVCSLEEDFENPLPLQLESSPLSRNVLCKFPTVGTVLRMTADRCPEKLGLHLLKAGKWVHFRNISFEVRHGFWCGILLPKSKFSYLANEDNLVLQYQKTYDERVEGKWYRMPLSAFPSPSHITGLTSLLLAPVYLQSHFLYFKVTNLPINVFICSSRLWG